MHAASVKKLFDRSVSFYDQTRRQLVPCYDEFYHTAAALVPFRRDDVFRVLDLGAGTGLLSLFLSERFHRAHFTLMDISAEMLQKARERFNAEPERFAFSVQNYSAGLQGRYDLVVSALSIHHLNDAEKAALFHSIYAILNNGALFINADQVKGATEGIDRIYREVWLRQVTESGIAAEEFSAAKERMKADMPGTLESQLGFLKSAGFRSVNCWYKNYSFVVYSGCRQAM